MDFVYGVNPVIECLRSGKGWLKKIIIATGKRGESVREIINMAKEGGVPVEFRERAYVDKLAGSRSHQGMVGLCELFSYVSPDDVILNRHTLKGDLILILDSIVDPQNLGSLIRTASCYGANGIIIPENRAASVTAAVMKASAGAACHTSICKVVNLARTIEYLKEKGFWMYGADVAGGQKISSIDYDCRAGLIMGSEEKGIRPSIRGKCDFLVSIPIKGKLNSLNVSVAAGIIMYEITRQWGS